MWIYDDLCNGEYHTCHIFFPPIEISWCNFEVKFLKNKKKNKPNKQTKKKQNHFPWFALIDILIQAFCHYLCQWKPRKIICSLN